MRNSVWIILVLLALSSCEGRQFDEISYYEESFKENKLYIDSLETYIATTYDYLEDEEFLYLESDDDNLYNIKIIFDTNVIPFLTKIDGKSIYVVKKSSLTFEIILNRNFKNQKYGVSLIYNSDFKMDIEVDSTKFFRKKLNNDWILYAESDW